MVPHRNRPALSMPTRQITSQTTIHFNFYLSKVIERIYLLKGYYKNEITFVSKGYLLLSKKTRLEPRKLVRF